MPLNLRRMYTQITADIIPGLLRKLGRKPFQPVGRERPASDEWSMSVPFAYSASAPSASIAVICHIFHGELTEEIISFLSRAQLHADLFISTDAEDKAKKIRAVTDAWRNGRATVQVVENRGRDIAPKLITFSSVYEQYQLILFLHSKRSDHYDFGRGWRNYLFESLAGSPAVVQSIQEIFKRRPDVGMVVPPHYPGLRKAVACLHWGFNFRKSRRIAWKMDVDLGENGILDFPSGSMFWARPTAIKPLLRLKLEFSDFQTEPCRVDGTLAHCIERLFLFSCESAGLKWVKVVNEDVATPEQRRVIIGEPKQIDDFIAQHGYDLKGAQAC